MALRTSLLRSRSAAMTALRRSGAMARLARRIKPTAPMPPTTSTTTGALQLLRSGTAHATSNSSTRSFASFSTAASLVRRAFSTASTPTSSSATATPSPAASAAAAGETTETSATAAAATIASAFANSDAPRKFSHAITVRHAASVEVSRPSIKTDGDYALPHPIWSDHYLANIEQTHKETDTTLDTLALWTIRAMRFNFDWMSGYAFGSRPGKRTERMWLNRVIFLETVAAVPGSIASTLRHLASLRRMRRDHGWIHTLLEEAENERMHLLTAIALRHPGPLFRGAITLTQGIFYNFYWLAYALSPRFCHRLVGYLEEEAVKTYTTLLASIDKGEVFVDTPAPPVALAYWRLPANATMRDVFANIRADESHHRDVNHTFADMTHRAMNDPTPLHLQAHSNPFHPGH